MNSSPIGDLEPGEFSIVPLRERYNLHVSRFTDEEKPAWEAIDSLYSGKMWLDGGPMALPREFTESAMVKTSINLVFAIVETGRSSLVPDDPAVTVKEYREDFGDNALAKEAIINYALRESAFGEETARWVEDVILYGRGIFKVGWDGETQLPYARTCDLNSVFFDLEAKRQADIRYWMECTPLSKAQFESRIDKGIYPEWAREIVPSAYPTWLRRQNEDPGRVVLQQDSWYIVYEYYDVERRKVYHFCDRSDRALLNEDLHFVPYIIDSFNDNKKDCRGLSEISLIASNQTELNVLSSMLLEIVRTTIPRVAADSGGVNSSDVEEMQNAPIGSISMLQTQGGKSLASCFFNLPQPQAPNMLIPLVERLWQSIMFVSALADAQRGQVTGARTATELALIDAQIKNRLHSRQAKIFRLVKKVAEMFLYLMREFKDKESPVIVGDRVVRVGWDMLQGEGVHIDVVPFSPQATTREVLKERWMSLYPAMANDPLFDAVEVRKEFLKIMELPERLLAKTPPPQAAPPMPPGGGGGMPPGGMPPLPAMPAMPNMQAPPLPADQGAVTPSPSTVNPNPPLEQ